MSELVKIVENKPVPSDAIVIQGLPDVGLVGLIATAHIVSQFNLQEIAYIDSNLFPPIVVLHNGLPHSPLRIFANKDLIAVISEMPITADTVQPITQALVNWVESKKAKITISIGGIPVPDRQDLKDLKVFGAASNVSVLKMLQEKGVDILKEGYMVGPQALVMRYCAEKNIPAIALLAQSFNNYPDPEAAAAAIKELTNITGKKIDVSQLLEKGEEIRLRARDIMKRTRHEMTRMNKSREYDLPLYV